ncbi:unnamed protein product [Meloidogyne enterolobii]|uniref:Uncharacterized protein n=1 Tax=Meloidogyne enterolobii TaxID=390850 RepID=A0ACB0Y3N7_MELEN
MFPAPNSDQHTQEDDDPIVQNIPRTITQLEQYVAQVHTRLCHLNDIIIPQSELTTDFALPRADIEAERNRLRSNDPSVIRQLAESYLMRYKELERRNKQQAHRLDALETRVTTAETMADEAIRTLRQFVDAERRRTSNLKSANARVDSLTLDLSRYRNQCEQHEQTIARLGEQITSLNQGSTSLNQHLNKLQSDKNNLALERDRLLHDRETLSAQLAERDVIIETLRERERQMAADLRERDALIESLGEDRNQRGQELVKTRRKFNSLLEEKDHDMKKLLETKKKEVIAELKAAHLSKVEKYEETIRKQRKDFHDGLQVAYGEVTKLAAQRDEYYANWKRLEGTLEAHKRKLHAALSRKMVNKCSELVRDLKDIGGYENGHPSSLTPRTLEPVENVAQRLLNELAGQNELGNLI